MNKLKAAFAFLTKWYPYVTRAISALKKEFSNDKAK